MRNLILTAAALVFFLDPTDVYARVIETDVLDSVLETYKNQIEPWGEKIKGYAIYLFLLLATIHMVWKFGQKLLSSERLEAILAEFVRFGVITGFYWWLLQNGPEFAIDIIQSLKGIAKDASGQDIASPTAIVDLGLEVFLTAFKSLSLTDPVDSLVLIVVATAILVLLVLIGTSLLLLYLSAWMLAYVGVFYLGFGGAELTSDFARNYFKGVLAVAIETMALVLLIGIGTGILENLIAKMGSQIETEKLVVVLVSTIVLFVLITKLPKMLSGIVTASNLTPGALGGSHAMAAGATGMAAGATVAGSATAVVRAADKATGGQIAKTVQAHLNPGQFAASAVKAAKAAGTANPGSASSSPFNSVMGTDFWKK